MPQQTIWAAFVRSCGAALLTFFGSAYAAFTYLDGQAQLSDGEVYKGAAIAGIGAVLASLGWRAGVEGGYDSWRQSKDAVSPADVQVGDGKP